MNSQQYGRQKPWHPSPNRLASGCLFPAVYGNDRFWPIPILIGGLEHFYIFPCIGNNNPNWRTYIFQRGWNHQPAYLSWFVFMKSQVFISPTPFRRIPRHKDRKGEARALLQATPVGGGASSWVKQEETPNFTINSWYKSFPVTGGWLLFFSYITLCNMLVAIAMVSHI